MGRFTQEYALLQQRLDAALPDILLHESDPKARAESYLFPRSLPRCVRYWPIICKRCLPARTLKPNFHRAVSIWRAVLRKGCRLTG
jgi:type VI protein secretion system component VasK